MDNPETTQGPPRKPLLFANNPFNDARIADLESINQNWDRFYVPGYSEVRRENDTRAAKGQPQIQQDRLQWIRVNRPDSSQVPGSDQALVEFWQLGYEAIGLEGLESRGYGMPPAAEVGADGLIRIGDLALFVVGEERADYNRKKQREATLEMSGKDIVSNTGEVYEVKKEREDHSGSLRDLTKLELPK